MKKFISLFLSLTMLLTITAGLDLTALASTKSGSCGANVTWKLNTKTGKLTITGTGDMYDYTNIENAGADTLEEALASFTPWYRNNYCKKILSVTVSSGVTSIGREAFSDCTKMKKITISNSVTSIGDVAFGACTSLTSITIPESVMSIGDNAFGGCSGLKSITIPDSVKSIDEEAFYNCTSLKSITISDGVTSIGDSAFYGCTSLTSIIIPDSVTEIGNNAFKNCKNLSAVTIGDSVISIGNNAFYKTAYYNDLSNWENGVLYIGNYLIKAKVSDSEEYEIKDGTLCIAANAFSDLEKLESIIIPDSVKGIGKGAFKNCESLSTVTIGDNITRIGSVAFYNTSYYNDTSNWKKGVLYIGNYLIRANNTVSNNYKIKNGTLTIADRAFKKRKNLKSITIPSSLKNIGKDAFLNSYKLKTVNYTGKKSQWKSVEISDENYYLNKAEVICANGCVRLKASDIRSAKLVSTNLKIVWEKVSGVDGYEIQYAEDSEFSKNKKTVTVKKVSTTSISIKGLNSKKCYYTRIRTYKTENGKKLYSNWATDTY